MNSSFYSDHPYPWLVKESIWQKFFSFKGRLGREDYFKRLIISDAVFYGMLLVGILGIIVAVAILAAIFGGVKHSGQPSDGFMILMTILILLLVLWLGVAKLATSLSLAVRRLHDLGYSGKWLLALVGYGAFIFLVILILTIVNDGLVKLVETASADEGHVVGFANFLSNLLLLFTIPLHLVSLAFVFFPGDDKENSYGKVRRERKNIFESAFQQIKKEFFSFSGRLNRKWFIGMWVVLTFEMISAGMSFLAHGILGIDAAVTEGSLFTGLLAGFNALLGVVVLVTLIYSYLSLVVRRSHDMGFGGAVGIVFFLFQVALGSINLYFFVKIYIAFQLSVLGVTPEVKEVIGYIKGMSLLLFIQILGMVLFSAIPGNRGENQYGPNPVEVGLLPGEKWHQEDFE